MVLGMSCWEGLLSEKYRNMILRTKDFLLTCINNLPKRSQRNQGKFLSHSTRRTESRLFCVVGIARWVSKTQSSGRTDGWLRSRGVTGAMTKQWMVPIWKKPRELSKKTRKSSGNSFRKGLQIVVGDLQIGDQVWSRLESPGTQTLKPRF